MKHESPSLAKSVNEKQAKVGIPRPHLPPAVPHTPWTPGVLRDRSLRPEWMDQPSMDPRMHAQALAGLDRLNLLSGAHRPLRQLLRRMISPSRRPVTVLDVACGSGHVTARAIRPLDRGRLVVRGIDASPTATASARQRLDDAVTADIFGPWRDIARLRSDVVFCALFVHHLEEHQVPVLLRRLDRLARRRVLVIDLERGWLAWWGVYAGTRLVTRSPVVRVDSALSVQGAFRRQELPDLLARAGIEDYRLWAERPARWGITWKPRRPPGNS